jgi:tRNA A37 threonylcarbamoyladenosine dehydratase
VTVENASELLAEGASYVVDCIDNLDAKAEVVRLCK